MSTREHLYFLPIGGTATAPLAGLLRELGHIVEGVDATLYPPMSTLLEELEIPVRIGFDPDRIPTATDRVIIGNAVPRSNPEVRAVLDRRIPHLSQAEAVAHYVLGTGRQGVVVAGTHGKTTTTAMLAWILEQAGDDPSYLIGGLPRWNRRGFRLGSGSAMVIEGDEYNTAFFDRGPKFLHYRPHVFLLGPVEFDHADLYRDLEAVLTAFRAGAALVPSHGALVVNAWSAGAIDACRDANAPIVTVGPDDGCDLRIIGHELDEHRSEAAAEWHGRPLRLDLPQPGLHNLQNGGLAVAAAAVLGIEPADAVNALRRFPGVARRMEVVGETGGLTVVDDFAHHPTALAVTIEAARQRWPHRRLVVAFEPRSLTAASGSFQDAYLDALSLADLALVAPAFHRQRVADALDRQRLADDLEQRGVPCLLPAEDGDPAKLLVAELRQGDVVVGCSSGDFGGFHQRVIELWTGGES